MVFFHILKMFSSNTKNSNHNLRRKTFLKKRGTDTVSSEHLFRQFPLTVVNDISETILEKIPTHSYHGFVLYIRSAIAKYTSICSNQHCFTSRNQWLVIRKETNIIGENSNFSWQTPFLNFTDSWQPCLMNGRKVSVTPLSMHCSHISPAINNNFTCNYFIPLCMYIQAEISMCKWLFLFLS